MKTVKTLLLSLALVILPATSHAQMTEGQGALVGGIIGYMIGKNQPQPQPQVQPIYAPQYQPVPQQPIVVYQGQLPSYNATNHGYCAGYQNEQYAYCMGNIQRKLNQEAYQRGLMGR